MKGNPRSSGYAQDPDHFYQEGPDAINMLINVESFPSPVWDPACGEGNIPKVFKALGVKAIGTDLVDRGYGKGGVDFLKITKPFDGCIVSNPPFDLLEPFIHHALRLGADKVAVIGRLAFLEGQKRKATLFDVTPFSKVWVFSRRISMPPGGKGIVAKGGSIAFAWFIFEADHPVGDPAKIGFLA